MVGVGEVYIGEPSVAVCLEVHRLVEIVVRAIVVSVDKGHHIEHGKPDWNVANHDGGMHFLTREDIDDVQVVRRRRRLVCKCQQLESSLELLLFFHHVIKIRYTRSELFV
jgi:hypothetical protein